MRVARLPDQPRAVVTGAGSGLGRAFCLELARRGARIVVSDIDLASAEETAGLAAAAGGAAIARRADVSKPAEIEALAEEAEHAYGGTDLLINNAGVGVSGPIGKVPLADWEWIIGVNLWGVIHGCHVFVPRFRARGAGHVLNVASTAGLVASPDMGPYNVTKFGVVALSETLHAELAGTGIGVTVLCPTFFRTNITKHGRVHPGMLTPEQSAKLSDRLMDRAKIQADDVARIALDAASRGKLYVLPHADGRWAWRAKRLMPETFERAIVPRAMASMRRRVLGSK